MFLIQNKEAVPASVIEATYTDRPMMCENKCAASVIRNKKKSKSKVKQS